MMAMAASSARYVNPRGVRREARGEAVLPELRSVPDPGTRGQAPCGVRSAQSPELRTVNFELVIYSIFPWLT